MDPQRYRTEDDETAVIRSTGEFSDEDERKVYGEIETVEGSFGEREVVLTWPELKAKVASGEWEPMDE
jgi:hypothetical protein